MRAFNIRASLFLGLLAVGHVAAQSLPQCANKCVGKTQTKCKSTDYACACSDGKYIPKLMQCIDKTCDEGSKPQAHGFLASLCLAVGYPIVNSTAPAGAVMEMLDLAHVRPERVAIIQRAIIERQASSGFDQSGLGTSSTRPPSSKSSATGTSTPASNSAKSTSSSTGSANPDNNNNNNNGNGGGGGSLSTGAKIGIGVGVPLGVGLIAGLVTLAWFLGRRGKKQQAAGNEAGAPPAPGMVQQPYMAGPPGPAELDQSAQYIGLEMPTKGNVAEMPAGSSPPTHAQPAYGWPQQAQPHPGQQQFTQYAQPGQGQYPQPAPQHYPSPGLQWPQQGQPDAVELPERMRSPPA